MEDVVQDPEDWDLLVPKTVNVELAMVKDVIPDYRSLDVSVILVLNQMPMEGVLTKIQIQE
jgi:hypothetical protein